MKSVALQNFKYFFQDKEMLKIFLIAVAANIPFLLYFFDYFNLNVDIAGSSTVFFGINPYSPGSQVVAGFMIMPYNLLAFFLYLYSNFSLVFTYVSLKIIGICFIFLTGLLLYRIASTKEKTSKFPIIGAIVFNPLLLYFNDIAVSTFAIPMFFSLLSYYLIFHSRKSENVSYTVGALSLLIGAFTYYFPLLLLPAFVLYVPSLKRKIKLSAIFIILLATLYSFEFLFRLGSSFTGTLTGGSAIMYPYSIFNLLPIYGQETILENQLLITLMIGIISIAIPVINKILRMKFCLSAFMLLSFSLLLQPSGTYADSFAVAFPFAILVISFSTGPSQKYWRYYIPQLYVIPEILVGELLNGPGYATGIFYWLYPVLHKNIVIIDRIPNGELVWKLMILTTILLFGLALCYLYRASYRDRMTEINKIAINPENSTKTGSKPLFWILVVFIVFLFVIPVSLGNVVSNSNTIVSDSNFPTMLFIPHSSTTPYQLPSPYEYEVLRNDVFFYPTYGAVSLYRNLSSENSNFNFNFGASNVPLSKNGSLYPIFNSNLFIVSLSNLTPTFEVSSGSKHGLVSIAPYTEENRTGLDSCASTSAYVGKEALINGSSPHSLPNIYVVVDNLLKNKTLKYPIKNDTSVYLSSALGKTVMRIANQNFYFNSSLKFFAFGKLSFTNISVIFSFSKIVLSSKQVLPNYLIILLSSTLATPALTFAIYAMTENRFADRFKNHQ